MIDDAIEPFLTVETGEAYQPIRLTYALHDHSSLLQKLNTLKCIQKSLSRDAWAWYWRNECSHAPFQAMVEFFCNLQKNEIRLATLNIQDNKLYVYLPSFKRACLALAFFHFMIDPEIATLQHSDFINKIYNIHEPLPRGFADLFNEQELNQHSIDRVTEYLKVMKMCAHTQEPEDAMHIFLENEAKWNIPYAERYVFHPDENDFERLFLTFYTFLRTRELVALKHWIGETDYNFSDVTKETAENILASSANPQKKAETFFGLGALFQGYFGTSY